MGRPPPQGSSLGFGLFCPDPSSLNRPHASHSQAHRDFVAWRLIRDAFAVRERLGTSDSELSLSILSRHAALNDPGEFRHRQGPVLRCRTWPSPGSEQLGTPIAPAIRFTQGTPFGASRFTYATACRFCSPSCDRSDLQQGPELLLLAGLSPARVAASFAAPRSGREALPSFGSCQGPMGAFLSWPILIVGLFLKEHLRPNGSG
jgi:hypothetical protein